MNAPAIPVFDVRGLVTTEHQPAFKGYAEELTVLAADVEAITYRSGIHPGRIVSELSFVRVDKDRRNVIDVQPRTNPDKLIKQVLDQFVLMRAYEYERIRDAFRARYATPQMDGQGSLAWTAWMEAVPNTVYGDLTEICRPKLTKIVNDMIAETVDAFQKDVITKHNHAVRLYGNLVCPLQEAIYNGVSLEDIIKVATLIKEGDPKNPPTAQQLYDTMNGLPKKE